MNLERGVPAWLGVMGLVSVLTLNTAVAGELPGDNMGPPPGGSEVTYSDKGALPKGSNRGLMDFYTTDNTGEPVFYEGQLLPDVKITDMGDLKTAPKAKLVNYERVFQFVIDKDHPQPDRVIRRGYLTESIYGDSAQKIEWFPRLEYFDDLLFEVAEKRAENLRRAFNSTTTNVDYVAKPFAIYKLSADGLDIFYAGVQDENGREIIFRRTLNARFFDRGYIEKYGSDAEYWYETWTERNIPRDQLLEEVAKLPLQQAARARLEAITTAKQNTLEQQGLEQRMNQDTRKAYPDYKEDRTVDKSRPIPSERALVPVPRLYRRLSPDESARGFQYEPIPTNRSMVEYNPPESQSETPDPLTAASRPSRLRSLLGWTAQTGREFHDSVADYMSRSEFKSLKAAKAKIGRATATMARSGVRFYTASGILAAIELSTNYSADPRAWTAWLEESEDPIFYLTFGGFVMAAAPFYQRMGPLTGPATRVLPLFASAMVVGGVTSKLMSDVLYDPNFQKCYGFESYKKTGKFTRDYVACDALYDKWANARLDNEFLPFISNMVTTSVGFYGSLRLMQYVTSLASVQSKITQIVQVLKIPPWLARAPKSPIAMMGYFLVMWGLSNENFGPGKAIADWQFDYNPNLQYPLRAAYDLLTKGFAQNGKLPSQIREAGDSYADSENKVYNEWNRIRNDNWKNPFQWTHVCLDSSRNEQLSYDCDHPDKVSFDAVLNRYSEMQKQLRERLMGPTMASFKAWATKVYGYNKMIQASYAFYGGFLNREGQAKRGHLPPYLEQKDAAEMRENVNDLANEIVSPDLLDIVLPRRLTTAYKLSWPTLVPKDSYDFMLASMACGPEAEPYGGDSLWKTIYQTVLGGDAPATMAAESHFADVKFFPPRITEHLPGNAVICNQPARPWFSAMWSFISTPFYTINEFPTRNSAGTIVQGLDRYVADHLRADVFDPNDPQKFNTWWDKYVMTPQKALQAQFRKEYIDVLKNEYLPALQNQAYHWCELPALELRNPALEQELRTLGSADDCAADATHRQARGVFNSLSDELRLYSAMLLDTFAAVPATHHFAFSKEDDVLKTLNQASTLMKKMQNYLGALDASQRPDIGAMRDEFKSISEDILNLSNDLLNSLDDSWQKTNAPRLVNLPKDAQDRELAVWQADTSHIPLILNLLKARIEDVFDQAVDYEKILLNFEVTTAKENDKGKTIEPDEDGSDRTSQNL